MTRENIEVKGKGWSYKGKGTYLLIGILLAALLGGGGWFVRHEVLAASKEHSEIKKAVQSVGETQRAIVKILSKQTEFQKIQLELLALPPEQRKQFLEIYKSSPTWKGEKGGS